MGAREDNEVAIRAHVEEQVGEAVVHAERAASEMVGPVKYEIWDVHCSDSRWWVVTNPMNVYDQADFKSRDVVLSFHIGLMMRVAYLNEKRIPVAPQPAYLLPGSWRRWEQAFESYNGGGEAENFQAVGVRLRECLISFVGEAADESMLPHGATPPKSADVKGWTELLADHLAPGSGAARLRSYLATSSTRTGWRRTAAARTCASRSCRSPARSSRRRHRVHDGHDRVAAAGARAVPPTRDMHLLAVPNRSSSACSTTTSPLSARSRTATPSSSSVASS